MTKIGYNKKIIPYKVKIKETGEIVEVIGKIKKSVVGDSHLTTGGSKVNESYDLEYLEARQGRPDGTLYRALIEKDSRNTYYYKEDEFVLYEDKRYPRKKLSLRNFLLKKTQKEIKV